MTLLAGARPVPPAGPAHTLFERVAEALNSTLDLGEVLRLLAEAGLDATGAAGTAVLLLDGRQLVPATVVRVVADPTLHDRFFGMPPVQLDDEREGLLRLGRAIVLEDARASDLVPRELVERFSLRGFALVPLMAGGEPYGVMCVDWDEVRAFAASDIDLLEAFGAYAGMAVRNARVYTSVRRRAHVQAVLAKSATNLASPVAPDVIAGRLADAYVQLTGARLCAIALLDSDRREVTRVAVRGGRPVRTPLALSDVPAAVVEDLIERTGHSRRPVAVDNEAWFADHLGARADVHGFLAVPVVAGDRARGVVLLGFGTRPALGEDEAAAAEVLAGIAAAALERHELLARLDSQVQRLAALQEVSAALNSSASLGEVLDVVCAAFEAILGASHCSVNLLEGADPDLRTLSHRGVDWIAGHPETVGEVPRREVERLRELWSHSAEPVVYAPVDDRLTIEPKRVPAAVRSVVLFPLAMGSGAFGVVVVGFPRTGGPGADDLETGRALADLAATAIDRAALDDALRLRLQQVETLYGLSDVVAGTADLEAALRELNRRFEPELGLTFESAVVASREVREAVGGQPPASHEMEAIRSWRASLGKGNRALRPRPVASGLLVPVVHRTRLFGALRVAVSGEPTSTTHDLLVAIGTGCAEIIYKTGLSRDLADRERRLAIAAERERIARDLHDSVGQVMAGVGMMLTQYADDAPDAEWRERIQSLVRLVREGAGEIREAVYSLMFMQTRRLGLVASVRELARKFEAMTGIVVRFELDGDPETALPAAREDALFRVAYEALMNIERHAKASNVSVELRFTPSEARLVVRDDGVGLQPAPDDGTRHLGLTSLERRMDEVGGDLHVATGNPSGTVVQAVVSIKGSTRAG